MGNKLRPPKDVWYAPSPLGTHNVVWLSYENLFRVRQDPIRHPATNVALDMYFSRCFEAAERPLLYGNTFVSPRLPRVCRFRRDCCVADCLRVKSRRGGRRHGIFSVPHRHLTRISVAARSERFLESFQRRACHRPPPILVKQVGSK